MAATSINKEEAINEVAEEIELDFDLIGSTAIEDKLQEDVASCIHEFR